MKIVNQGPRPPAVLSLSDGGHIENLGILPLLKLRLNKIVSVDGGRTILDEDYGSSLLTALDLARKKLGCSFSGLDGRDIAEDIRDKFVETSAGSQPRSYRSVSWFLRLYNFLKWPSDKNMSKNLSPMAFTLENRRWREKEQKKGLGRGWNTQHTLSSERSSRKMLYSWKKSLYLFFVT